MTQISALFSLLGLLGYPHIRLRVNMVDNIRQYILLALIVWTATLLALLGKGNGVLLPLLILIAEFTLLINLPRPPAWNKWLAVVLVMPMIILCLYLIAGINETLSGYRIRDFSLIERLLTQPRVLLDYIKILILPIPSAFGLYHDDYVVSRGLIDPPSTIISILVLFAIIVTSLNLRKRSSIVSFSILWFFAGHILESSFLNLELYFEHRNYLPLFGVSVFISWAMIKGTELVKNKVTISSIFSLYYVLVILVTVMEVQLWSKPEIQIVEWVRLHPQSFRAKNDLAGLYVANGNFDNARSVLSDIHYIKPESLYPVIQEINITSCHLDREVTEGDWLRYYTEAEISGNGDLNTISALDILVLDAAKGKCRKLDLNNLSLLIQITRSNSNYLPYYHYLDEFMQSVNIRRFNFEVQR